MSGRLMKNAIAESAQSASPEIISLTESPRLAQRTPMNSRYRRVGISSQQDLQSRHIDLRRKELHFALELLDPAAHVAKFSVTSRVSLIVVARFRICRYCASSA